MTSKHFCINTLLVSSNIIEHQNLPNLIAAIWLTAWNHEYFKRQQQFIFMASQFPYKTAGLLCSNESTLSPYVPTVIMFSVQTRWSVILPLPLSRSWNSAMYYKCYFCSVVIIFNVSKTHGFSSLITDYHSGNWYR